MLKHIQKRKKPHCELILSLHQIHVVTTECVVSFKQLNHGLVANNCPRFKGTEVLNNTQDRSVF